MRKLVITISASVAILFLILIGWSANAVTGPGGTIESFPQRQLHSEA